MSKSRIRESMRLCVAISEEWFDVKHRLKQWRPHHPCPTPFKSDWRSPLRDLITGDDPSYIRIDPAHTYAIDGIGKSFLASSIVLLMRMEWFGLGSVENKFARAYARFISFCEAHGKDTTIMEFDFQAFKLPRGSFLFCK